MVKPSGFKHAVIFQCILFLIPVNIFLLGEGVAAGVQWVLFRYQQSYLGNSLIIFTKDLYYVNQEILTGKSAIAAEIAFIATIFIVLATILLVINWQKESPQWVKASAVMTMGSGCLYLVSDIFQYGFFFNGPSGFVIPIGVPVILGCGWWMYQMSYFETDPEELECAIPSDEKKTEN